MTEITPPQMMQLIDKYVLKFIEGMEYIEKHNIPKDNKLTIMEKFVDEPIGKLRKISADYYKMLIIYKKLTENLTEEQIQGIFVEEYVTMVEELKNDKRI